MSSGIASVGCVYAVRPCGQEAVPRSTDIAVTYVIELDGDVCSRAFHVRTEAQLNAEREMPLTIGELAEGLVDVLETADDVRE